MMISNKTSSALLCAAALQLFTACGDGTPMDTTGSMNGPAPMLKTGSLTVQAVDWNPRKVNAGTIAAVAELNDDTAVFSDQGVIVLTGNVPLATDPAVKSWRTAAIIPAGDLSGQWLAAVDGAGHVRRLRNRNSMEDITDRYGLIDAKVLDLADLGQNLTAFLLDKAVAVSDGQSVTRYDGSYSAVAGAGGKAALISQGGVRVFDPASKQARDLPLAGASAVVFDTQGKLVVAAGQGLYRENAQGGLDPVYQASAPIHGLAPTAEGTWVALGDGLALLVGDMLLQSGGGIIAADARIVGSPTGDVWALSGGALQRFEDSGNGGPDRDLWKRTVLPIFTRLCSICHLPGGSASIDLSTYKAWVMRRQLVKQRVLVGKPTPMPPAGVGTVTDDERAALKAWIDNQAM